MTVGYWCDTAVIDGVARRSVRLTVTDGRFASVEPDTAAADGDRRLAGVTIPGLANAHSHVFHRALRSRTQRGGGTFWSWRDVMYRAAERLEPDRLHAVARATFAEMALAGVTCVGEFHYVHHQADGTPYDDANAMGAALVAGAESAGIRMTLLDTLYLNGGLDSTGYVPPEGAQRRFSDGSADAWAARIGSLRPTEAVHHGAAIHSVRAVDPASMDTVRAWAERIGAPVHAHVSEQLAENDACLAAHGVTPTELLDRAGIVGSGFTAVHATHLARRDIELLAPATVCMCPTTERDLGDGIGPTIELVAAGTRLALGSDSHAVIDLLDEARALELDERLRSMRRGAHDAAALVAAATVHGHRSLGWNDAGTIGVGARADLVTISSSSPRTAGAGADAALEAVVFAASAADVTDVVVDGRDVVVDRRHVGIDVARELDSSIRELMGD